MIESSDTVEDIEVIPQEIGPALPQVEVVDNRPALVSPYPDLIKLAITEKATVEIFEKLFDLNLKWEKNEARKAFHKAMAAFKANEKIVLVKNVEVKYKTKKGHNVKYKHVDFGKALSEINESMGKYGLSMTFKPENKNESSQEVTITCYITHSQGYHIESTLSSPPDDSGGKNPLQAIGSALAYLAKYTGLPLSGFTPMKEDDDANIWGMVNFAPRETQEVQYISVDQQTLLQDKMTDLEVAESKFFKYLNVESLEKIPASTYRIALAALKAKEDKAAGGAKK